MTSEILDLIIASFPLTEREAGEYAESTLNGMPVKTRAFYADGLGNVSLMVAGMPGIMEMITLVVNPFERDMPLFSYDRIQAGGKDQLFLELYDTGLGHAPDTSKLAGIAAEYAELTDMPLASAWYDDILYKESIVKAGPDSLTPTFDEITVKYLGEYLRLCGEAPVCDCGEKKKAAAKYTEGLLEHGGTSTDVFMKAKGRDFTEGLFRNVLFGTGDPKQEG